MDAPFKEILRISYLLNPYSYRNLSQSRSPRTGLGRELREPPRPARSHSAGRAQSTRKLGDVAFQDTC